MMNSTPAAYPTAAIVDHKPFVSSMNLMDPLSLDYGTGGLSTTTGSSVIGVNNSNNGNGGLIGTGVNGIVVGTQNGSVVTQNSHLNHLTNSNHPHHHHHSTHPNHHSSYSLSDYYGSHHSHHHHTTHQSTAASNSIQSALAAAAAAAAQSQMPPMGLGQHHHLGGGGGGVTGSVGGAGGGPIISSPHAHPMNHQMNSHHHYGYHLNYSPIDQNPVQITHHPHASHHNAGHPHTPHPQHHTTQHPSQQHQQQNHHLISSHHHPYGAHSMSSSLGQSMANSLSTLGVNNNNNSNGNGHQYFSPCSMGNSGGGGDVSPLGPLSMSTTGPHPSLSLQNSTSTPTASSSNNPSSTTPNNNNQISPISHQHSPLGGTNSNLNSSGDPGSCGGGGHLSSRVSSPSLIGQHSPQSPGSRCNNQSMGLLIDPPSPMIDDCALSTASGSDSGTGGGGGSSSGGGGGHPVIYPWMKKVHVAPGKGGKID